MHTLYSMQNSGNCYKLRLAMHQLSIPFRLVDIDILKGETHTPDFLALNANGKVPAMRLDDGRTLSESNAMLFYLAEGSRLIPQDRYDRAVMLQWMFFEQYSHEPYVAVARYWLSLAPGGREAKKNELPGWLERGHKAFAVMEERLKDVPFFAGSYSLADIALYAYTHVAHEGDFDLSAYPAINAWMERLRAEEGFVPMEWRP